MAATLKQLRDQIILDAGVEGHTRFPIVRLNRIINLSQRYTQTQLNGLGMKKWETSLSPALTAASFVDASGNNVKRFAVTLLTNMLESPNSIILIEVDDGGSYSGVSLPVDVDKFRSYVTNSYLTPTVLESVFMRLSGYVYLAPVGVTSATVHYYKAITDLSSDSTTTEIPLEFEEFIIKKAVLEIEDTLGKLEDKIVASKELEKDLSMVYNKFAGKEFEQSRFSRKDNAKVL